jgi:hypothetical protein
LEPLTPDLARDRGRSAIVTAKIDAIGIILWYLMGEMPREEASWLIATPADAQTPHRLAQSA